MDWSILTGERQAYMLSGATPRTLGISLITFRDFLPKTHPSDLTPDGSHVSQKKRIMIVEDERDIAFMFKSGLERNGFSVVVFNDPLDALADFKPDHYDLLLMDIRMPRMSGFELGRAIRKLDGSTKVCFITAFEVHQEEMRKYLSEEDEKCVVKKPISMKELVKVINEAISGSPH